MSASSSSSSPFVLKVKAVLTGECRRVPLHQSPPLSFALLLPLLHSLFAFPSPPSAYPPHQAPPPLLRVQFKDEDDELITINTEEEWERLQEEARERQQRLLVLFVSPSTPAVPQQPPARPVAHGLNLPPTAAVDDSPQSQPLPSDGGATALGRDGQVDRAQGRQEQQKRGGSGDVARLSSAMATLVSSSGRVEEVREDSGLMANGTHGSPLLLLDAAAAAADSDDSVNTSGVPTGVSAMVQAAAGDIDVQSAVGGESATAHVCAESVSGVGVDAARADVLDEWDGADGDSPVLVDAVGVPSAPDSRSASAMLRRRQYRRAQAKRERKRATAATGATPAASSSHSEGGVTVALPSLPLPLAVPVSPLLSSSTSALHIPMEQRRVDAALSHPSSSPPPPQPLPALLVVDAGVASPHAVAGDDADGDDSGGGDAAGYALSPTSLFSPPPSVTLTQHFDRARAQLRSMLPFSSHRSSPATKSREVEGERAAAGGSQSSPFDWRERAEQQRSERIDSAYACLASFIVEEGERLGCEEILQRCISLYTYTHRWIAQQRQQRQQRRQQLAIAGGSAADGSAAAEEEEEEERAAAAEEKLRSLLCDAQDCGLRSQSLMDAPSPALSPAQLTVLIITQSHLRSHKVTDLPVTLELMAAILAQQSETVRREEREISASSSSQLQQQQQRRPTTTMEKGERKESEVMDGPRCVPVPTPPAVQGVGEAELAAALAALPLPLQRGVRAALLQCVQHAVEAAALHPTFSFSSLSPHSFASALQAFRTNCADLLHDEAAAEKHSQRSGRRRQERQRTDSTEAEEDGEHQQRPTAAVDAPSTIHQSHQPLQAPPAAGLPLLSSAASGGGSAGVVGRVYGVSAADVLVSDESVLKAVAKALLKEQKAQRRERKTARRKAGKGKANGRLFLDAQVAAADEKEAEEEEEDREAKELTALIRHMQSQQPAQPGDSDSRMIPGGWTLFPDTQPQQPSGARLPSPASSTSSSHPSSALSSATSRPPFPLSSTPSPSSPAMAPSPFAYRPFPYNRVQAGAQGGGGRGGAGGERGRAASHPRHLHAPLSPSPTIVVPSADPALHPAVLSQTATPALATSSPHAQHLAPHLPYSSFASVLSSYHHQTSPAPAPQPAAASPLSQPPVPSSSPSPSQSSLLSSLRLMGFTDERLNLRLLQQNDNDLNSVVEWLLTHNVAPL